MCTLHFIVFTIILWIRHQYAGMRATPLFEGCGSHPPRSQMCSYSLFSFLAHKVLLVNMPHIPLTWLTKSRDAVVSSWFLCMICFLFICQIWYILWSPYERRPTPSKLCDKFLVRLIRINFRFSVLKTIVGLAMGEVNSVLPTVNRCYNPIGIGLTVKNTKENRLAKSEQNSTNFSRFWPPLSLDLSILHL